METISEITGRGCDNVINNSGIVLAVERLTRPDFIDRTLRLGYAGRNQTLNRQIGFLKTVRAHTLQKEKDHFHVATAIFGSTVTAAHPKTNAPHATHT